MDAMLDEVTRLILNGVSPGRRDSMLVQEKMPEPLWYSKNSVGKGGLQVTDMIGVW